MLVFAVGGEMSVYEGVARLNEGRTGRPGAWTYAVLGGAADRIQGRLKTAVPKLMHVFLEPAQELHG